MVTVNRPAYLTSEQLEWAMRMGISPDRAYWLASCPANTNCGSHGRPDVTYNKFNPDSSYLFRQPPNKFYYFRIHRKDCRITRKLSRDLEKSKAMRDAILREMNITPKI